MKPEKKPKAPPPPDPNEDPKHAAERMIEALESGGPHQTGSEEPKED